MTSVVTASTVVAYATYTVAEQTIAKFGTTKLVYTLPFVIYGIFRYLYLVYEGNMGENPEKALLRDKPLIIDTLLWFSSVVVIVYS